MDIFIDTNVFLSFYHMTNEDLGELQKLVKLIKDKEITLYIPQQVLEEAKRNRANKLKDSLELLQKIKFSNAFPSYCKQYPEYEEIKILQKKLEDMHAVLIKEIQKDIDTKKLKADILLEELFEVATLIKRTTKIVEAAKFRADVGNPPGKRGSLGDAINWESLLLIKPPQFQFAIVSDDADFSSPLDPSRLNPFLLDEWSDYHSRQIYFYRKLSDFFKKHYPNIRLESELEKDRLIEALSLSKSFARTHDVIADLSKYEAFTTKQTEDLIAAVKNNKQVNMIFCDKDVHGFYDNLYKSNLFDIFEGEEELGEMLRQATKETDVSF